MRFWVTISLLLLAGSVSAYTDNADTSYGSVCWVTGPWINCDSIYASDDQRAYIGSQATNAMRDSAFTFSITDTIIDSIIVLVEGHGTAFLDAQREVLCWFALNGTNYGDTVSVQLNRNSDNVSVYRHSSAGDWNTGFDESNLSDGRLTVILQTGGSVTGTIRIDGVQIVIWHHNADAGGGTHSQVIIMGSS